MSGNDKGKKHVHIDLTVDSDFTDAVEKFGFADTRHFFKRTVRALLEAYRSGSMISWPLELFVKNRPLSTEPLPDGWRVVVENEPAVDNEVSNEQTGRP